MKHKNRVNPFVRIFVFAGILLLTAAAAAAGFFYYMFGIPEPEGLSLASWPHVFTDSFSVWMKQKDGTLKIEDIGIDRLDEYGLWLQVIDETGKEVFSHNKPDHYPSIYSASQLTALSTSPYEKGSTVFASKFDDSGKTWTYFIGFPYAIGKYMLYYNGEHAARLSPVFRMGMAAVLGFLAFFVLAYGFWLTGHVARITKGVSRISLRTYSPLPEKGLFRGIYRELNKMDAQIRASDQVQKDIDQTRREWISNITHDLKTPLSPIKGYGELLSEIPAASSEAVQEYGSIILKNANHAESLINDLKLTYQLESGVMPCELQEVQFVPYVREIVIDLINDPAFCTRRLEFETSIEDLTIAVDPALLRRAVENLIINALIYNPPDTEVMVEVKVLANADQESAAQVIVRDNGTGLSREEQSRLFDRYYRGASTKEKPQGTGLGLAIAKQIIGLHNGSISVKSSPNEGTEFIISLPID